MNDLTNEDNMMKDNGMSIVVKLADHIKLLLGNLPFNYIDATYNKSDKYASLEDYIRNCDYFWTNLTNIESNKYSAANILTTFLKDQNNYQLFIKDYALLKLSGLKPDGQFIPSYLKDKLQLVHFLQNADLSINSNSWYFKEETLKNVIKKLCVSNIEDNKLIIKNLLETNKKFISNNKVKIYLKKNLYEIFYDEVEYFSPYYKPQSNKESLIVNMEETKVVCIFLDKKYLMSHYEIDKVKDIKEYLKMLKQIAEVIKKEFKLIDLKITEYNPNTYNVIALVKEDFNYNLTQLWEPLIEQFLLLSKDDNDKKTQLAKHLKTMILYQDIDSKIPNKEEVKTITKKLKI